jgi:hypothetical protein
MPSSKRMLLRSVLVLFLTLGMIIGVAGYARASDLIISGVFDGPLSGGLPKAVEFYVVNDIDDLSIYGFGSANNGGGTDGQEFSFPAQPATGGTFLYVASEAFGFTPKLHKKDGR